jgi:rRNA-processing protein FCF1
MSEQVKHVIRFPQTVYAKLKELAEIDDRSINSEVVVAVKLLIEKYEQEHGPLADASETSEK